LIISYSAAYERTYEQRGVWHTEMCLAFSILNVFLWTGTWLKNIRSRL